MFLTRDYILANELVEKMGIHIANISMLRKRYFDDDDAFNIRKMNNSLFINIKTRKLPKYIKRGIRDHEFTDLSNLMLCTYIKSEFKVTERELSNSGIVIGKVKVAGKLFYVFDPEFAQQVSQRIPYILNLKEKNECTAAGTIQGSVQLSKNKFFTWY